MHAPRASLLLPLALLGCGGSLPGGNGGGVIDDPATLAGPWLVTRTLITSPASQPDFPLPVQYPVGFSAQDTWTFTVAGQRGTLTSLASSVDGAFASGQWTFSYVLDAGSGLRDDAAITITSTSPRLRGAMTHRYSNAQRTWLEVWTLDGVKQ